VQRTGPRSFREVSHPPAFVDVELHAVLTALHDHDST